MKVALRDKRDKESHARLRFGPRPQISSSRQFGKQLFSHFPSFFQLFSSRSPSSNPVPNPKRPEHAAYVSVGV